MSKFSKVSIGVLIAIFAVGVLSYIKAATTVTLGSADNFAILAGSGITIGGAVNTSAITGDIGSFPTATITGTGNAVLTGTNHGGDATTQAAKTDLTTAYNNAAGQTTPSVTTVLASTIDSFSGTGYTLPPGIYQSPSSMGITGTLTLNGTASDVWIFQAGSTLTTAGASNIILTGGAQACNVFWQVGSSATLGASSFFKGNILAFTSIGLGTTANVEGRTLAQNGAVTLDGSNIITKATCVVPPPAPVLAAVNTSGSTFAILPLIDLTKIPNPLALPAGPGPVTYSYVAKNIGTVPMIGAWVRDNKCSPVNYVSGDTNNDQILDVGESWKYTCTRTVSQTDTNTATAHGQSNGWDVYRTANATVVVGAPIVPPLIHLVKTPNVFILPAGGGPVTYSYAVTNPGVVPMHDVSITDNKCTGLPGRVISHPGDLNKNNLLDPGETWQFTCQTNLTQTTTNIGTAEGHANGLTAIDFAPATVVVASPGLPNTGYPPETTRNIAIVAGAIIVAIVVGVVLKKRSA